MEIRILIVEKDKVEASTVDEKCYEKVMDFVDEIKNLGISAHASWMYDGGGGF